MVIWLNENVKLPVAYSLFLRKPPRRPSRLGEREGHIIETKCGDDGLLVHVLCSILMDDFYSHSGQMLLSCSKRYGMWAKVSSFSLLLILIEKPPKGKKIVLYEIISREDSQEITCDMRNHTIANISGSHIHQAKNDRHNQCV